jgi:hypothetical protein
MIGERAMRRAILIIVLILSIFQLGGCVVISCEERSQQGPLQAKCAKTGQEDPCAAGSFSILSETPK